jgi:type I restriction enzyme, S subunit
MSRPQKGQSAPDLFDESSRGGEVSPLAPASSASTTSKPPVAFATPLKRLPEGWIIATLDDLVSLQRGHDLTAEERKPGTIPVFGSAGQNGFHNKWKAPGPGVVIGRSGASFGKVHFSPTEYWPHNTALYVTDFKGNDEYFSYLLLSNIDFSGYNSGSAQPSLNRNFLSQIPIKLPPVHSQKKIAAILSSLDDKIALNRTTNQTIEAIAQALFKSWFVDFDPVHAKARGEKPLGMDDTTAALFPDSFEDSELGKIPRGWEVNSIYKITEVVYGPPFASNMFKEKGEGLPLIRIRDLKDEHPGVVTEENHPKGYKVTNGDLLVGMDGEFRSYIWGGGPAWMNQRICCFLPKEGNFNYLIKTYIDPLLAQIEASETATTVIHLGKSDIDKLKIIYANDNIYKRYADIAKPIIDKFVNNKIENSELQALRDSLLPKLLSGEISVAEAASLAEGR